MFPLREFTNPDVDEYCVPTLDNVALKDLVFSERLETLPLKLVVYPDSKLTKLDSDNKLALRLLVAEVSPVPIEDKDNKFAPKVIVVCDKLVNAADWPNKLLFNPEAVKDKLFAKADCRDILDPNDSVVWPIPYNVEDCAERFKLKEFNWVDKLFASPEVKLLRLNI